MAILTFDMYFNVSIVYSINFLPNQNPPRVTRAGGAQSNIWWIQRDSNPWPLACEANALTS